jgi:hypothetical protein
VVASELRSATATVYEAARAVRNGHGPAAVQSAISQAREAVRPVRHGAIGRELARLLNEVERCRDAAVRRSALLDSIDRDVAVALALQARTAGTALRHQSRDSRSSWTVASD